MFTVNIIRGFENLKVASFSQIFLFLCFSGTFLNSEFRTLGTSHFICTFDHQNLIVMPFIKLEKCTRCLKCVKDCPAQAITIETGEIADSCIHCGHCVAICPEMAVRPDFGDVFMLQPHAVTPKDFRNLASEIRSCRNYLQKDVPDAVLLQLVDNMKHYPSASNARPLQISIVRSKEKVKLLNDLTEEALIRMFSFVCSPWISPFLRIFVPSMNMNKLKRYRDSFINQREVNDSQICHHDKKWRYHNLGTLER